MKMTKISAVATTVLRLRVDAETRVDDCSLKKKNLGRLLQYDSAYVESMKINIMMCL